jgi:hypothetical protein
MFIDIGTFFVHSSCFQNNLTTKICNINSTLSINLSIKLSIYLSIYLAGLKNSSKFYYCEKSKNLRSSSMLAISLQKLIGIM